MFGKQISAINYHNQSARWSFENPIVALEVVHVPTSKQKFRVNNKREKYLHNAKYVYEGFSRASKQFLCRLCAL